ncbi:kinase-like domain-containing protein [Gigaspora rosea]|uniref:Kinase-like domain-containing protein n=1 Tax=Gigaspora rosea TaxID=44941 RepID=A0A397VIQ4_9GLOM|nr:kinase-like domain-containing protein [Gigaspora rosea]
MIEWIPFDGLVNLQKIREEESETVFMATWLDGKRIIECKLMEYTRSRIKSCGVNLKILHGFRDIFIEKLTNYMQDGNIVYGISQNTETKKYIMVIPDELGTRRNASNGSCVYCKQYNTSPAWCQSCDPLKVKQEITSGDKNIDDCIREFQLKATAFEKVIEWIPFERLENIKIIGKGGFGTVYSSIWLDGKRKVVGDNNTGHVRFRIKLYEVALKTLPGSQTSSSSFLTEFKNHMQCRLEGSELEVYGLTRNTDSQYMMVYQYANRGNLSDFLTRYFRELVWQEKLNQLADISYDLSRIHKTGLIHKDFHSGNILLNINSDGVIKSYITDLGLSRKQDEHDSKEGVYGVMPYVAPDILMGQKHTQEADIYGLGIIMAEMSTGQRPYYEYKFDTKLAVDICKGLHPKFAEGTPDCYIELANQCMDSISQNRPTAEYVHSKIDQWKTILKSENLTDEKELDIKNKFIYADSIIKKMSSKSLSMLQNEYCSKLIDVPEITKSLKVSTQVSNYSTKQFALELPTESLN